MRASRRPLIAPALIMLLLVALNAALAQAQGPRMGDSGSQPAAVQLIAADEGRGGRLTVKWAGSGVIISPDGLILTNCQVAMPRAIWDEGQFDYDLLIVSIPPADGLPPQPTYIAEVVQYDATLDLAVARITQTLDGSPVALGSLRLPFAPLADSDTVQTGNTLQVSGYSDAAGSPLTTTAAQVTGFASGRGVAGRAWIRTDAAFEGGISGGPALDAQGNLIAVVAVGAAGSADDVLHCRFLDDTNGDGRTDQGDACTPTGGATGALRPANLAMALVQAAGAGIEPQPTPISLPTSVPAPSPTPLTGPTRAPVQSGPRLTRVIFAPAVNDYDQPSTVIESFPSGAQEIYVVFDYADFEDNALWHTSLVYDGVLYDDIWSTESWAGGRQGTSWMSINNNPLADGTYEFVFSYDGQEIGSAAVTVGGPPSTAPSLSSISFVAGGYEGYLLPAGAESVDASVEYDNFGSRDQWFYVWYLDGAEISAGEGGAVNGTSGTTTMELTARGGLAEGRYRLDLFIGDRLAATSDFMATSQVGGADVFGPITFAEGVDRNDSPLGPGSTLPYGITEIYAFFDYQGMRDGWQWSRQWYLDGQAITSTDDAWAGGESGENFWVAASSRDALPQGEYSLELYVEGELVQQGTASIRGGTAPTPTPAPVGSGVEFYGTISDAASGRGIPSAFFLVLKPGVTSSSFTWAEDEVYTWAETDPRGAYELPVPLIRGETYSMIIGADGYLSIAEDGVFIGDDAEDSYQIDIALSRVN